MLQQVANQRLSSIQSLYDANSENKDVHVVKQQTATFQTKGSWVRPPVRYTSHTNMLLYIHINVYNLDIRILTYTPV